MIVVYAIIIISIIFLLIDFNAQQEQKDKPESKYKVVHSTMVTYTDDSFTQMFFLENEFGDRKTVGKIPYEYSGIINMWLLGDIDTKELKCLNIGGKDET